MIAKPTGKTTEKENFFVLNSRLLAAGIYYKRSLYRKLTRLRTYRPSMVYESRKMYSRFANKKVN